MWNGWMVEFGFRVDTDYLGDEEKARSKSAEEVAAMEEVGEQLGSPLISFEYLPKGMEYEGYEITNKNQAALFYSYWDTLFYVTITNLSEEGSYYYKYDNEAVYRETVESHDEVEAEIWEVNQNTEDETYIAELEYKGWRYVLNGMLPLGELEKIVEWILVL